jgi:hypothetical protein
LVSFFSDDHCDIVSFLHSYFRGKKITNKTPVVFFHIDAHSDLSIPSLSQSFSSQKLDDWENVDALYDILSEEGGIAEFIIPLVTTELISQIIWIRSEWSLEQLPDGLNTFQIRDHFDGEKYHPKVNWKTPYYIEDNSFLPFTKGIYFEEEVPQVKIRKRKLVGMENNLEKELDISVLTSIADRSCFFYNEDNNLIDVCPPDQIIRSSSSFSSKTEWILDICLDYFSTNNPFYTELLSIFHQKHKSEILPLHDNDLIQMIQTIYQYFPYRLFCNLSSENFDPLSSYHHCRQLLYSVLFDSTPEIQKEFLVLFWDQSDIKSIVISFLSSCDRFSKELKEFIYEKGYLLLLPYRTVEDKAEIDSSITKLKSCILNFMNLIKNKNPLSDSNGKHNGFPLFVTIATSQSDNYTSIDQYDYIYEQVFLMLEELFCSDKRVEVDSSASETDEVFWNQQLKVHDIRKEPIEMAYLINWKK